MVGFIKRLLGLSTPPPVVATPAVVRITTPPAKPAPPPRQLAHPRDLQVHDMLVFQFMDHQDLSGKRFQVTQVHTYVFGDPYPTFSLQGDDNKRYHLMVLEEEGQELMTITRPIKRNDVGRLFRLEEFAELFEEKMGAFHLERHEEPRHLLGWTAAVYYLSVDALKGTFFEQDLRQKSNMPADQGAGLDYYMLIDDETQRTVEIEVYDGGETEVSLGLRLPVTTIAEMWPAS